MGPMDVIFGFTRKSMRLVENPLMVTTITPVVALCGTGTVRLVLLQEVGEAGTLLTVTVLAP